MQAGRFVAAILAAALLTTAAPVHAQQQQPAPPPAPATDPLLGQFGAIVEVAPPPPEAARLANLLNTSLSSLEPQRRRRQDVYLVVASLWDDPSVRTRSGASRSHSAPTFGRGGIARSFYARRPGARAPIRLRRRNQHRRRDRPRSARSWIRTKICSCCFVTTHGAHPMACRRDPLSTSVHVRWLTAPEQPQHPCWRRPTFAIASSSCRRVFRRVYSAPLPMTTARSL
jgi:hypothetical protein